MDNQQQTGLQTTQKSNKTWLYVLGVVVVLALIGLGVWALTQNDDESAETTTQSSTQTTTEQTDTETDAATAPEDATTEGVEIVYTDDGFAESSYTVAAGSTVTVKNDSSSDLQFSSDDHPSHLENSELNQAVLASGQSQQFTVSETGTWGIHDHLNASNTTTLVVE